MRLHESSLQWVICPTPLSPSQLALLASLLQLAVALSVNLDLSACKHVLRCHVADRTVQPDMVITIHILLDQAFCIFQ